ncbi:uncharacterized protein LOC129185756 isoform X2 [Dunckerocampus dactyliophorus]|uniref:uncharacterized protein LOC129185756 isoform X2 n=1 Tax=Dunckerocampus dactyliophorus TaxID=161453 RepID=UPI0024054109|nr:uncharacterized protein LOC129185756 isoform X2 [Dunckerocampus dactyliophorus]
MSLEMFLQGLGGNGKSVFQLPPSDERPDRAGQSRLGSWPPLRLPSTSRLMVAPPPRSLHRRWKFIYHQSSYISVGPTVSGGRLGQRFPGWQIAIVSWRIVTGPPHRTTSQARSVPSLLSQASHLQPAVPSDQGPASAVRDQWSARLHGEGPFEFQKEGKGCSGEGVFSTWLTGRDMDRRSVPGFPASVSLTPPLSAASILFILINQNRSQEKHTC